LAGLRACAGMGRAVERDPGANARCVMRPSHGAPAARPGSGASRRADATGSGHRTPRPKSKTSAAHLSATALGLLLRRSKPSPAFPHPAGVPAFFAGGMAVSTDAERRAPRTRCSGWSPPPWCRSSRGPGGADADGDRQRSPVSRGRRRASWSP
jgi:hypothetical protein